MNINVICVGSIKETYFKDAISEYSKRLSRFVNLKVIEVKEEKLPKNFSQKDVENVCKQESLRLIEHCEGFVVLCSLKGKMLTSEEIAKKIDCISNSNSTISFVIGGSYGVSAEMEAKANLSLCFSKQTFPHQMFRVMLLEQIYRAYTILNNITYHK